MPITNVSSRKHSKTQGTLECVYYAGIQSLGLSSWWTRSSYKNSSNHLILKESFKTFAVNILLYKTWQCNHEVGNYSLTFKNRYLIIFECIDFVWDICPAWVSCGTYISGDGLFTFLSELWSARLERWGGSRLFGSNLRWVEMEVWNWSFLSSKFHW